MYAKLPYHYQINLIKLNKKKNDTNNYLLIPPKVTYYYMV